MSVQKKILLVILPIMLVAVSVTQFLFKEFFIGFLEAEEDRQAEIAARRLGAYLSDTMDRYRSMAGDWSHWDDTQAFVLGDYEAYPDDNLDLDSVANLDASFMLFLDKDRTERLAVFYDLGAGSFADGAPAVRADLAAVLGSDVAGQAEYAGYHMLDGALYVLAVTEITDSARTTEGAGYLAIGRIIDGSMLQELGESTGCGIRSVGTTVFAAGPNPDTNGIRTRISRSSDRREALSVSMVFPGMSGAGSGLVFETTMEREFYNAGRIWFRTLVLAFMGFAMMAATVLFLVLRRFINRPLVRLVQDVERIRSDGFQYRRVRVSGRDEFTYLQNVVNNMIDRIETEQIQLKSSEEKLYATLVSVGDGVIAVDREQRVEFLNPVAQTMTGWSQEDAAGQLMDRVFDIVNEFTGEPVASPVAQVFKTGEIVELANHTQLVARDGVRRSIEDTAAPIRDKAGEIVGCVLVFRDCGEKKEKQRRIEYLSYHDQLTGLYNRRFFEEELERLDKRRSLPLSVIYADLNGLKTINDTFGHPNGDKMISLFAKTLQAECREDDIIARVGGDEFVVLLPRTDHETAEKMAHRLKMKLGKKKIMNIPVSVSFGCDTKSDPDQSVHEIMKNAENIMYHKKTLEKCGKRSQALDAVLDTLALKSPREKEHAVRVGELCEAIGRSYGLDEIDALELHAAGELHDIGKIGVDEALLNKSGPLSPMERTRVMPHAEIGYRLLVNCGSPGKVADAVLSHHERWDGAGYPRGLRGEEIEWSARAVSVAEAYDTMTTGRGGREPMPPEEAVAELLRCAGTQFDPDIVRIFAEQVAPGETRSGTAG